MDSSNSSDGLPDLSKISEKDKQELNQFVQNETQKARIQQTVHNLTDICWKKCVTGSIRSGSLDKSEDSCAKNCVDRYLDANFAIIKQLDSLSNRR